MRECSETKELLTVLGKPCHPMGRQRPSQVSGRKEYTLVRLHSRVRSSSVSTEKALWVSTQGTRVLWRHGTVSGETRSVRKQSVYTTDCHLNT